MGGLKLVMGAAGFNPGDAWPDSEALKPLLELIKKYDVNTIDTAQLYGESEAIIGGAKAGETFTIDTKTRGGFDWGKALQPDTLYKLAHESIEKLKVKQVDIFYIHAPDDTIPPTTWMPVIEKLHKEGMFKRLGVSNFPKATLEELLKLCKENGWTPPSVYQGNYSAVARRQETELFPFLRENNMAFYAYSPIAGGFLTKTREAITSGTAGRFSEKTSIGSMYQGMYSKPSFLSALDEWGAAADNEGVTRFELAFRWVSYHSALKAELGDAIIFGARNLEQAEGTLKALQRGPLKESTLKMIEEVWEKVRDDAPLDNFNSYAKPNMAS